MIEKASTQTYMTKNKESAFLWHLITGHPSDKVLRQMLPNKVSEISSRCDVCIKGKMCRKSFHISESSSEN